VGRVKVSAMCMVAGGHRGKVNLARKIWRVRSVKKLGAINRSPEIVLFIQFVEKRQWTVADGSKLDVAITERRGKRHHQETKN